MLRWLPYWPRGVRHWLASPAAGGETRHVLLRQLERLPGPVVRPYDRQVRPRLLGGVIGLSSRRMRRLRLVLAGAALAACAALVGVVPAVPATAQPPGGRDPAPMNTPQTPSRPAPEAAWVELGPSGAVLVRAISKAEA
jgi:hypothetical protein